MKSMDKNYYSKDSRKLKYKNLLEWVKTKTFPERKKIITEIKISNYFDEYDKTLRL